MTGPIEPEELPQWVPGDLTLDTVALGWNGIRLRGYRYGPLDVLVPPLHDYMIVAYGRGATPMARQCAHPWRKEHVGPGNLSLLTDGLASHWRWSQPIDVTHLYISPEEVSRVGCEVFDRDVEHVDLHDTLKADDPELLQLTRNLQAEASGPGLGGRLYADTILNQASIHILRRYADVAFRALSDHSSLSPRQKREVLEYIHSNIHRNLSLRELAGVTGLSTYCFARRFRHCLGVPPHEFLLSQRVDYAQRLLRGHVPLKVIAARSGFSDQSHMSRVFRKLLGVTPGQYRKNSI